MAVFVAKSKSIISPQWIGSSVFEKSALGKEFEKREATNTRPFLTCGFIPANPPTLPSECQDYLNITSSGDDLTTDEDTLNNATSQFCTPLIICYFHCNSVSIDQLFFAVSLLEHFREAISNAFYQVHYLYVFTNATFVIRFI